VAKFLVSLYYGVASGMSAYPHRSLGVVRHNILYVSICQGLYVGVNRRRGVVGVRCQKIQVVKPQNFLKL